ncbi:MAG: aminotransferase class IV, partial [Planctomycetaceae bacterium]
MMTAEGQLAWCNGTFLPADALAVPYFDLGVVAGASVTEMARTYGHRPFRLERHVRRLTESLKSLGFPCEYQSNDWIDAAASIVEHNAKQTSPRDELGIVMFATAGTNPTYLGGKGSVGTAAIHTFRLPFELWRTSLSSGARLSIPSLRQISSQSLPVDHKIRNRLHWWLADRQATDIEPGSRALLLNAQNLVTETSTSAFHAVINGEIVTSDRDVLASISSEVAEELATT